MEARTAWVTGAGSGMGRASALAAACPEFRTHRQRCRYRPAPHTAPRAAPAAGLNR